MIKYRHCFAFGHPKSLKNQRPAKRYKSTSTTYLGSVILGHLILTLRSAVECRSQRLRTSPYLGVAACCLSAVTPSIASSFSFWKSAPNHTQQCLTVPLVTPLTAHAPHPTLLHETPRMGSDGRHDARPRVGCGGALAARDSEGQTARAGVPHPL